MILDIICSVILISQDLIYYEAHEMRRHLDLMQYSIIIIKCEGRPDAIFHNNNEMKGHSDLTHYSILIILSISIKYMAGAVQVHKFLLNY